ncbi:hypothetical protein B566_EDAN012470 [Ephemera danica]|nr:hypothetical protein B566_EDAN012470 [Ephemera danica]
MVQLTPGNKVQLRNVHTPQKSIDTTRMRGHCLSSMTLEAGVPVVMLQHYINQTLYLLVNPAIVTLALQHSEVDGRASRGEVFAKYKFLRALLAQEFALHKAWDETDFEDTLKQLDLLHIAEEAEDGRLVLGNHRKLQTLLLHLLSPFLGGYLACCHSLAKVSVSAPVGMSQILQESQHKVEKQLGSGQLSHHYCLSLDLLSACVAALSAMGALTRSKDASGKVVYQGSEEKLRHVASTLEDLLTLQKTQSEVAAPDTMAEQLLIQQERAKL